VVIAGVPSFNGSHPGVVALGNLSNSSVDVRFREWDYLDGWHSNESVSLLALAPGRHTMPDGSIWEVGRFALADSKVVQNVHFSQPFDAPPAVFLTAQTSNDPHTATTRIKTVNETRFRVSFNEQESLNDGHGSETIGYLAIHSPTGSGTALLDGIEVDYQLSSSAITHNFASVQPGHEVKVEEEQSADSEILHTLETVVTLNLQNHLFAQMNSRNGSDTAALRRRSTVVPDTISDTGSEIFYYHSDHLGTPQLLTDENQNVVWEAHYDPFGEAHITTEQITNNIRFPGQYYDEESGLHYNYFRYYDPSLGRYITSIRDQIYIPESI
jgi:RHS repeat-associated protein